MEPNSPKRILIVEDDHSLRDFFVFDFEQLGFEVVAASGGRSALDLLSQKPFDVLISDVALPEVSGIDLARAHIQWHKNISDPVTILMTGHAEIENRSAYDLGVQHFLYKPFHRGELLDSVARYTLPRIRRWGVQTPPQNLSHELMEIGLRHWSCDPGQDLLRFGQGGFCLKLKDGDLPERGTHLGFVIRSEHPQEPLLEGFCCVRWAESAESENVSGFRGIGCEVLSIRSESSREALDRFLTKLGQSAFIPAG